LNPGTRLGPYEITGAIGAGGMGEVYRARVTKLHRDVAVKVLPAIFASDPDRLARFEREAQTLAALNHPNIAQIFGIESQGSTLALVMELVEGEDLAHRIARGPLLVEDALPIATQIAEALEAAHECGIIHRDLKPANIRPRGDGVVKVLDFGLAKALDPIAASSAAPIANSPTFTSPVAMTQMGLVPGTAAYMSPEQAKGRRVDRRADIWAFGVVLYEMIAERPLFSGETVAETLAAVLRADVDWTALPPQTPPPVRRLLQRCLERDPKPRDMARAGRDRVDHQQPGVFADFRPGRHEGGAVVRETARALRGVEQFHQHGPRIRSLAGRQEDSHGKSAVHCGRCGRNRGGAELVGRVQPVTLARPVTNAQQRMA
jgi:serine/threonine protein kinase